jgi:hypothetical protein
MTFTGRRAAPWHAPTGRERKPRQHAPPAHSLTVIGYTITGEGHLHQSVEERITPQGGASTRDLWVVRTDLAGSARRNGRPGERPLREVHGVPCDSWPRPRPAAAFARAYPSRGWFPTRGWVRGPAMSEAPQPMPGTRGRRGRGATCTQLRTVRSAGSSQRTNQG